MSQKSQAILNLARALSDEDRRALALQLLDSTVDPAIARAWLDEAQQRSTQLLAGDVEPLTTEDLYARLAVPTPQDNDRRYAQGYAAARAAYTVFDRGRGDSRDAMSLLAEAFPTLRRHTGVRPWDQIALWTQAGALSSGGAQAAAFVLSVFNPRGLWLEEAQDEFPEAPLLRFDLHRALANWDEEHLGAFNGWASRPWWP